MNKRSRENRRVISSPHNIVGGFKIMDSVADVWRATRFSVLGSISCEINRNRRQRLKSGVKAASGS